jgi:hypothetical protein
MGSRSREPTGARSGAHRTLRTCMCLRPKDSRSREPTEARSGA